MSTFPVPIKRLSMRSLSTCKDLLVKKLASSLQAMMRVATERPVWTTVSMIPVLITRLARRAPSTCKRMVVKGLTTFLQILSRVDTERPGWAIMNLIHCAMYGHASVRNLIPTKQAVEESLYNLIETLSYFLGITQHRYLLPTLPSPNDGVMDTNSLRLQLSPATTPTSLRLSPSPPHSLKTSD
jgi:hypothetical protein